MLRKKTSKCQPVHLHVLYSCIMSKTIIEPTKVVVVNPPEGGLVMVAPLRAYRMKQIKMKTTRLQYKDEGSLRKVAQQTDSTHGWNPCGDPYITLLRNTTREWRENRGRETWVSHLEDFECLPLHTRNTLAVPLSVSTHNLLTLYH